MTSTSRVAVLLDCENVSAGSARAVLAETARHGTLSVKRAYGDFSAPHLRAWRELLPALAIQPVQQLPFTSAGKNGSDAALIVDAMDLLYTTATDVFCIVSSDSDFTRLATRLRESGKRVYGMGNRGTAEAFRNACDRFTYLDLLRAPEAGSAASTSRTGDASPSSLLRTAIEACVGDDGWAPLSAVGAYIVNNHPTFDSREHGHAKLGGLARSLPGVEVTTRPTAGGSAHLWVRAR